MVFPFKSKKPRGPVGPVNRELSTRHAITPAAQAADPAPELAPETEKRPGVSQTAGPVRAAPPAAAGAAPQIDDADVAVPFTGQELRRAQQQAMRMRQQYGAIGAKKRCQALIAAANSAQETRYLQLILRSIGGAG